MVLVQIQRGHASHIYYHTQMHCSITFFPEGTISRILIYYMFDYKFGYSMLENSKLGLIFYF